MFLATYALTIMGPMVQHKRSTETSCKTELMTKIKKQTKIKSLKGFLNFKISYLPKYVIKVTLCTVKSP